MSVAMYETTKWAKARKKRQEELKAERRKSLFKSSSKGWLEKYKP